MDQCSEFENETKHFSAVLTPHRSLSPQGFLILMSLICLVSFGTGFVFYFLGAWPVLGFFGLDVLLIYIAFRLNYYAARLYETVDLTDEELRVTRVHPTGRHESWTFNPYWVRLEVTEHPSRPNDLTLFSHGSGLTFGAFLTDDEKRDFAEALGGALQSHRTPRI